MTAPSVEHIFKVTCTLPDYEEEYFKSRLAAFETALDLTRALCRSTVWVRSGSGWEKVKEFRP